MVVENSAICTVRSLLACLSLLALRVAGITVYIYQGSVQPLYTLHLLHSSEDAVGCRGGGWGRLGGLWGGLGGLWTVWEALLDVWEAFGPSGMCLGPPGKPLGPSGRPLGPFGRPLGPTGRASGRLGGLWSRLGGLWRPYISGEYTTVIHPVPRAGGSGFCG